MEGEGVELIIGLTESHIKLVPGTVSTGLKFPLREADEITSSVDIKKEWSYFSTHPVLIT